MLEEISAVLTILFSLVLVLIIIALSWWFMWKVFLSRFEFINEIFFPDRKKEEETANNAAEQKKREGPITRRKTRKD